MYIDILHRLRDAVRKKRPEKWRTNSCFLLHDNAPTHRSVLVKYFLRKSNVTTAEHAPYTHGLTAADFKQFTRLKSVFKRRGSRNATDIKKCGGRAEKTFTKLLPVMFPKTLHLLTEMFIGTMEPTEENVA